MEFDNENSKTNEPEQEQMTEDNTTNSNEPSSQEQFQLDSAKFEEYVEELIQEAKLYIREMRQLSYYGYNSSPEEVRSPLVPIF